MTKRQTTLIKPEKETPDHDAAPLVFQRDVSINDVTIPERIKDKFRSIFTYFFPNQIEFVSSFFSVPVDPKWVVSDVEYERKNGKVVIKKYDNYLITSETSSGKTIIAMLYMAHFIGQSDKNTMVYLVPMKALAGEKFKEFISVFGDVCNIVLLTGTEKRRKGSKKKKTILITTNEKFDQYIRDRAVIHDIACAVIDELHLLNTDRGMTIETIVARLKKEGVPIMGLSATIENGDEIAMWLDAVHLHSTFRPIPITYGFIADYVALLNKRGIIEKTIPIPNGNVSKSSDPLIRFISDLVIRGESVICFRQSRSSAVSTAKKVASVVMKSGKYKTVLEVPEITDGKHGTDALLNACVRYGVAFHHAGIGPKNREFVENSFREREIRAVIATPTLSMGVNLPAKWVIIDHRAFRDGTFGDIPVSEVKQMIGRAGRPQYDREGYALLHIEEISEEAVEYLYEKYFDGKSEPITSKFGSFSDILMGVFGFISSDAGNTENDILELFGNSLIYMQSQSFRENLSDDIHDALKYLSEGDLPLIAYRNGTYHATEFGKVIAQLYVPPDIVNGMIEFINGDYDKGDFSVLYFIFAHTKVAPFRVKTSDSDLLDSVYVAIIENNIRLFDGDLIESAALKTASIIAGRGLHTYPIWTDGETDEEEFLTAYKISYGDLYSVIGIGGNLEWMLYSMERIARFLKKKKFAERLSDLSVKIRYGVDDKYVPLCRIEGIGKIYAKALYENGYRSPKDLLDANVEDIANVKTKKGAIGKRKAEKILESVKRKFGRD